MRGRELMFDKLSPAGLMGSALFFSILCAAARSPRLWFFAADTSGQVHQEQ